jgi:hypothetical protein
MNDDSPSQERPERSAAIERSVDEEVLEWYRMTAQERWTESMRLWDTFYLLGGPLEPESDSQSPFYDAHARRGGPADGRPGLRSLRRSGV